MRAIVCFFVAFLFFLCANVQAATGLDPGTLQQLNRLEKKYFGHSYDTYSDESRVERLEKLILGEPATGAPRQRIEKLVATIGLSSDSAGRYDQTTKKDSAEKKTHSQPNREVNPVAQEQYVPNPSKTGIDEYPHVTALENAILGQNYIGQPLAARLKRMETKAFGRTSDNPDFSLRTDALDQYTEQQLHKNVFPRDPSVESAYSTEQQPEQNIGDYPHVTELEKAILGQNFVGQPLADRLSRMETKAFGSPSQNPDLSQRTDALERYAEKTLHKKPLEQESTETATANPQQNKGAKILSMLGNSLFGMGPGGMSPMGMGMGGMGMGGMGMGGMGMGGMGRGRRNQAMQQPAPQAVVPQDDPAVHLPTPPPPNAKLLTKVGWCEVQIFEHTFSSMHLPERLGQLNENLNFKPGRPNIELMDDIGGLIKAVEARKEGERPFKIQSQSSLP